MGDNGDTIRVWSLDNGSEQYSFNKHASAVTPIAVSPKGHTVASASVDGTILLWGINSERVVANPRKLNIAATAVAFSPDGQWLVLAGWDREIRVLGVGSRHPPISERTIDIPIPEDWKILSPFCARRIHCSNNRVYARRGAPGVQSHWAPSRSVELAQGRRNKTGFLALGNTIDEFRSVSRWRQNRSWRRRWCRNNLEYAQRGNQAHAFGAWFSYR